jgi:hypothetical protein
MIAWEAPAEDDPRGLRQSDEMPTEEETRQFEHRGLPSTWASREDDAATIVWGGTATRVHT